ncbi:MAG: transcriptional regulator [Methanomicrobia archaeon]|nr:transcriptional regulator [Methanomicrobia archaeon]MCK4636971.1 transcriptional regulator [Methanomicrobia archaeon]
MVDDSKEKLAKRMAGEIVLSEDPGKTMKKWREIFGITQTGLAGHLKISSSVLSDYEGGRRKSPGAGTIKKFVEGLIHIDEANGEQVIHAFSRMFTTELSTEIIMDMREFSLPTDIETIAKAVWGEILTTPRTSEHMIYGYTVIDSIKAILEMDSEDFLKLYGWTTERALIFTKVTYGRSPMVAIKVKGLKPALVVLHGPKEMDPVAIKIAEIEKIPLIHSKAESVDLLLKGLRNIKL